MNLTDDELLIQKAVILARKYKNQHQHLKLMARERKISIKQAHIILEIIKSLKNS